MTATITPTPATHKIKHSSRIQRDLYDGQGIISRDHFGPDYTGIVWTVCEPVVGYGESTHVIRNPVGSVFLVRLTKTRKAK
jgi:hypothetical protein